MVKNKQKKKEARDFFSNNFYTYTIIAILVLLLYGGSINHGYVGDDRIVISENQNVQKGLSAMPSIFTHTTFYGFIDGDADKTFRPIPLSTYAFEIQLFGLNPALNHFFNIIYYVLLCCLIYFFLRKYLLPDWNGIFILVVTLLYVVHPIHAEVVSNIKSRDELLCFLFFMISIIFLFKYLTSQKRNHLIISILAYAFSLFSKETAVSFILIFPLLIFIRTKLGFIKILKLSVLLSIPVFVFLLTRYFVINEIDSQLTYINNGILAFESLHERYGLIFYILLLYVKLLFIPFPLIWDYSFGHFEVTNTTIFLGVISLLLHLSFFIYGFWRIKQKKLDGFLMLFYLITLSVVSNVFLFIGSTMGERFLFIPSLAFCIGLVLLLFKAFRIDPSKRNLSKSNGFGLLIIGILIIYSYQSFSRNSDWKDDYSLVLSNYGESNSYRARLSYIEVLYKRAGKENNNFLLFEDIKRELKSLIRDYPEDAEVWYMNGLINNTLNNNSKAILSYEKVLKINPSHLNALNNLGSIYQTKGIMSFNNQPEKAQKSLELSIFYLEQALEIKPNYSLALENAAKIYHMTGEYSKAKIYYEQALKIKPDNNDIHNNYKLLLNQIKERSSASSQY